MEHVRWIGFGAFFAAGLVVGIRLLLLSRRSGQLPELLIGVGVLGIGPLGFGLSLGARIAMPHDPILGVTLRGAGFLALFLGAASQYLFVWYVFRPHSAWARPLAHAAIVLLAAAYVGDILENGLVGEEREGAWYWLGTALRVGVLGWNACESLVYFRRMRRRLRLGLADAMVTERFLLWGIGAGSAFLGSLVGTGVYALTGRSGADLSAVTLLMSAHGLVAAIAMWLAFLPPAGYRRWVEARGRATTAVPWRPA